MTTIIYESPYLKYIEHLDDLHEFVFLKAHRTTIDEWYECTYSIIQQTPLDRIIKLLNDNRVSGLVDLQYAYMTGYKLFRAFPQRAVVRQAYLSTQESLVVKTVALGFLRILSPDPVQWFVGDARDAAIDWLRAPQWS